MIQAQTVDSIEVGIDLCCKVASDVQLLGISFSLARGIEYLLPPKNTFISNQNYTINHNKVIRTLIIQFGFTIISVASNYFISQGDSSYQLYQVSFIKLLYIPRG